MELNTLLVEKVQEDSNADATAFLATNQVDQQADSRNVTSGQSEDAIQTMVFWSSNSQYHEQPSNGLDSCDPGLKQLCRTKEMQSMDTFQVVVPSICGVADDVKEAVTDRRNRRGRSKTRKIKAKKPEQEHVDLEQRTTTNEKTIIPKINNETSHVSPERFQTSTHVNGKSWNMDKEGISEPLQDINVSNQNRNFGTECNLRLTDASNGLQPREVSCSSAFGDPIQMENYCKSGSKCCDSECKDVHPKGWKVCQNGVNCCLFGCQNVHPEGRAQKCMKEGNCRNAYCEYLHPDNWSVDNSHQSATTQLKCWKQREEDQHNAALPIWASRLEFIERLFVERVLVVKAQTGSGKTTQLPQYAADMFDGLVVCTQPRVIAAISIAQRIAYEFDGTSVGHNVGYRAGSQAVIGKKIMIVTDAALIRMAQHDRQLRQVSVLIIDEAHERSLNTDIVAGIAKEICQLRPGDFRVVISSATIDPKPFLDFFCSYAPKRMPLVQAHDMLIPSMLDVPGRVFPVTIETRAIDLDPEDINTILVEEVEKTLKEHKQGHCLVFLPGSREVDRAISKFNRIREPNWIPLPLYGSLPHEEQNRVLQFDDHQGSLRMVVFCTNVAETSLTVRDVRLVIDTGLAKEARYDAGRRITVLEQVYISQSSADQRLGRAGRTSKGHCVRLFTPEKLTRQNITPEILRSSLDLVMLQLCALEHNPLTFDFIDRPDETLMKSSIELLKDIGCISSSLKLTDRGRLFSKLPFDPRMSHFVLIAHELYGQQTIAVEIASILSAPGSIIFFGAKSDKTKKQPLGGLPEFSSDLVHLRSLYKRWMEIGDVLENRGQYVTCVTCRRTIFKDIAHRDGGCRPCRVTHSNTNSLNNKTLDIARKTVSQVEDIIKKWKVDQALMATSFWQVPAEEVIGRCLAWAFPEHTAELMIPTNPGLGVHLLFSNLKGDLSHSSALVLPHSHARFFIPMSMTKLPSGRLIIDQAHPVKLEWLPKDDRSRVHQSSLDVTLCYIKENVSLRYLSLFCKHFQNLAGSENCKFQFVVPLYEASDATLKVYAPQASKNKVMEMCEEKMEQLLTEDLKIATVVDCCNGTAELTFSAGMSIVKIEKIEPFCRVVFINPPVRSDTNLLNWVCKTSSVVHSDIKWCRFQPGQERDISIRSSRLGIVVFHNEVVANLVRGHSSTNVTEPVCSCALLLKMAAESVDKVLEEYNIKPVKFNMKRPLTTQYQIKISNIPEKLDTTRLYNLISVLQNHCPQPTYKHSNQPVNGTYNSLLAYHDEDSRDQALDVLRCTPVLNSTFTITIPSKRRRAATRDIEVTTAFETKTHVLPAEYILVFQSSAEADGIFATLQGSVDHWVDGFSTVKVKHHEMYALDKHVAVVAKRHSVKYRYLNHSKEFKVVFWSGKPSVCLKAAQDLRKVIAPIRYNFCDREKQAMGMELHKSKKLESWANKFKLHISKHTIEEKFIGFIIFGERCQQGQFMAQLADYYGSFTTRFHLIGLAPSACFLFRKGGLGDAHLTKLNAEHRTKFWQMNFCNYSKSIEIMVSPEAQSRSSEIIEDCKVVINEFLDKCRQPSIIARTCVYCCQKPGSPFYICGHNYCKECLEQMIQLQVRDMESPADGNLDGQTQQCAICCPRCDSAISVRDITASLQRSTLKDLCTSVARMYVKGKDHPLMVCPVADCQGLVPKQDGYSPCPACNTPLCPLCGVINDERHEQMTCKQYVQLLEGRTVSLLDLEEKVKEFARDQWELYCKHNQGQIGRIDINPGLQNGCKALQLYSAGIQKLKVLDVERNTIFAWHGTTTDEAMTAICNEGFDPARRKHQVHGVGEYLGITPDVSIVYSNETCHLIIVQLIKASNILKEVPNFCYVVNNPLDRSCTYNLPVAVASFGPNYPTPICWILEEKRPLPPPFKQPLLKQNSIEEKRISKNVEHQRETDSSFSTLGYHISQLAENIIGIPIASAAATQGTISPIHHVDSSQNWITPFCWKWEADTGHLASYPDDINKSIEEHYNCYKWQNGPAMYDTNAITRHIDENLQVYTIDFINNRQINKATLFPRRIKRETVSVVEASGAVWKFYDQNGTWVKYFDRDCAIIDNAYVKYIRGIGASHVDLNIGHQFYHISFISGIQVNVATKTERQIKREMTSPIRVQYFSTCDNGDRLSMMAQQSSRMYNSEPTLEINLNNSSRSLLSTEPRSSASADRQKPTSNKKCVIL